MLRNVRVSTTNFPDMACSYVVRPLGRAKALVPNIGRTHPGVCEGDHTGGVCVNVPDAVRLRADDVIE